MGLLGHLVVSAPTGVGSSLGKLQGAIPGSRPPQAERELNLQEGWGGMGRGPSRKRGRRHCADSCCRCWIHGRAWEGVTVPVHLGREVTNELTGRPQPPTRTSWVWPLGALARQRCLPCQVFVIKVDPLHQKTSLGNRHPSGTRGSRQQRVPRGVGTCGRPARIQERALSIIHAVRASPR